MEKANRAVSINRVGGDAVTASVRRIGESAVSTYHEPARCNLRIGDRRAYRGQASRAGHIVRGDCASALGSATCFANNEMTGCVEGKPERCGTVGCMGR